MPIDIEQFLQADLLEVPNDFAARVMQKIDQTTIEKPHLERRAPLRWTAFLGGGIMGLTQLASVVLGIWTATVAG